MFVIKYLKDGVEHLWGYRPQTREQALGVGHELTRDRVADYFRVEYIGG